MLKKNYWFFLDIEMHCKNLLLNDFYVTSCKNNISTHTFMYFRMIRSWPVLYVRERKNWPEDPYSLSTTWESSSLESQTRKQTSF